MNYVTLWQVTAAQHLCGYSITSANDLARRDPWAWRLLGRRQGAPKTTENSDASWWEILDSRVGQEFADRGVRREFSVDRSSDHMHDAFRLEILRVMNPSKADSVQFSGLDLLSCKDDDSPSSPKSMINADLTGPSEPPMYTEKDIGKPAGEK